MNDAIVKSKVKKVLPRKPESTFGRASKDNGQISTVKRSRSDQIETFNIPTPGHLTILCARGVGNLIFKAFSGVGCDLCLSVVGKIDRFQIIFFQAPKSLTAINTSLDEVE